MGSNIYDWPGNGNRNRRRTIAPFSAGSPVQWDWNAVPERLWIVEDLVPAGGVTLLSGDGGLGKSLLVQQLATAAALGRGWIGLPVRPCRVLALFCEDDLDELQRRQRDICRYYDCGFEHLENLHLCSRAGDGAILMDFNRRTDEGQITELYGQIVTYVRHHRIELVVIDTAADVFSGNENARPQVRAFIQRLRHLARDSGGAVVLTSHPSVAGLQNGSGISGSTAWHNSVRSRLYFHRVKDDEDSNGERLLKTMKSNYGRLGDTVRVRWQDGVFVPVAEFNPNRNVVDRIALDQEVVAAARHLMLNGAYLAADPHAKNGLAVLARRQPGCRKYSWNVLATAQDRLVKEGKLVKVWIGPPSRRKLFIRPADLRYPGEVKEE